MPWDSKQAPVPNRRSAYQLLEAAVTTQAYNVWPPTVYDGVAAAAAVKILADRPHGAFRFLQNLGTSPVKYAVNTAASSGTFHGVLAGGNAVDDGLGSILDFSKVKGDVYVYSDSTFRVCTFEAYDPQGY